MATLQLIGTELDEVRLLMGKDVVTPLTDGEIQSKTILGSASDYILEKVREDLDIDMLNPTEQAIAERVRDETDDDIANFVNQILKPPQAEMFRRAVIFRTAGNGINSVSYIGSESAIGIRLDTPSAPSARSGSEDTPERRQAFLYGQADEEIRLLREAFPDDAFLSAKQETRTFTFMKVTRC